MTIKLKYNKERFILFAILALCIFSCLILPGMITMLLSVLAMGYMAVAEKNALVKKNKITNSLFLVIPVFFSAFQNVYLAIGVNHQSSLSLQIMLSLHILLIMMMIILNSKLVFSKIPNVLLLLLVLLAYGLVMYVAYPAPITSLISASRNIISCMLIYVYAYTIGEVSDERAFYRYLNLIAWVVVLFGIYEYLGGIGIWKNLGITQLWNLKGIKTNVAGVPMNWFSSEKIGGQQLRRMVSTFADPVNLGTYLFAAFMISWYSGEKMLTLLLVGCCILTISKGALLGFLVFAIIYVWFKDKSKIGVPLIFSACAIVTVIFVEYSISASTGSMMAHIGGFISSLKLLITNPAGLGIGNVGVLSGMFSSNLSNTDVIETGIGVIIAELGWIGLICYTVFFVYLYKVPHKWNGNNIKRKILYYTILFSFILNALFNEVALSPNSWALYFIELAYCDSSTKCDKKGTSK